MALRAERHSARMSEIKNGRLGIRSRWTFEVWPHDEIGLQMVNHVCSGTALEHRPEWRTETRRHYQWVSARRVADGVTPGVTRALRRKGECGTYVIASGGMARDRQTDRPAASHQRQYEHQKHTHAHAHDRPRQCVHCRTNTNTRVQHTDERQDTATTPTFSTRY